MFLLSRTCSKSGTHSDYQERVLSLECIFEGISLECILNKECVLNHLEGQVMSKS